MSIKTMIDANVKCALCGSPGVGTCDCWVKCPCGWHYERGKACGNSKVHGGEKDARLGITHVGALPAELGRVKLK